MKKQLVITTALALALGMPLAACSNGGSATTTDSGSADTTTAASSDFDANAFFVGQWRGSVEITGQTVYGTAGGNEAMLDVNFNDDGTCTVVPLEAHADLMNASGTWEGTESTVTLTLDNGSTITLNVEGKANLSGNAADFGIADFETINFDFYG